MISVVTPTFRRPHEVAGLLENLRQQTLMPDELILVDGADVDERETEELVTSLVGKLPFRCKYIRRRGGTAIQRNEGIDNASGELIAFIDDDVRLEIDFFQTITDVFAQESNREVGGVVGFRASHFFNPDSAERWKWYRRLRLLTIFEPGRYDFKTGYPINAGMQPPFTGVKSVDFMTAACAVWKRDVFDSGLRFDPFFRDYGVLEDAHFSLRAGRRWKLLQCGDARCTEISTSNGREDRRKIGYKCVVNYYYVFNDLVGKLTWSQKARFWRFQAFELFRIAASAVRRSRKSDLSELYGRIQGFAAIARGRVF